MAAAAEQFEYLLNMLPCNIASTDYFEQARIVYTASKQHTLMHSN